MFWFETEFGFCFLRKIIYFIEWVLRLVSDYMWRDFKQCFEYLRQKSDIFVVRFHTYPHFYCYCRTTVPKKCHFWVKSRSLNTNCQNIYHPKNKCSSVRPLMKPSLHTSNWFNINFKYNLFLNNILFISVNSLSVKSCAHRWYGPVLLPIGRAWHMKRLFSRNVMPSIYWTHFRWDSRFRFFI